MSRMDGYTIDDLFGLELDDLGFSFKKKTTTKSKVPKALAFVNPIAYAALKAKEKKINKAAAAKPPTPEQKEAAKAVLAKILKPLAKTTAGKLVHASIKAKVSNTPIPVNQKGNPAVQSALNARIDADLAAREAKAKTEAAEMLKKTNPDSVETIEAEAEAQIAVDEGRTREAQAIMAAEQAVESATTPQPEEPIVVDFTKNMTYDQKVQFENAKTMFQTGQSLGITPILAKWNGLSQTQKIAVVGGGVAVTGLAIYLIYRATRPPQHGGTG